MPDFEFYDYDAEIAEAVIIDAILADYGIEPLEGEDDA